MREYNSQRNYKETQKRRLQSLNLEFGQDIQAKHFIPFFSLKNCSAFDPVIGIQKFKCFCPMTSPRPSPLKITCLELIPPKTHTKNPLNDLQSSLFQCTCLPTFMYPFRSPTVLVNVSNIATHMLFKTHSARVVAYQKPHKYEQAHT